MAWPPSWVMPTSKETRVRSEGFWKIIARVLPASRGWGVPALTSRLSRPASSRTSSVRDADRSLTER